MADATDVAAKGRASRPLTAAGRALDPHPERLARLEPSDPAAPMDVLRERFDRDGYLFLKGLLDPEVVLGFRGWVLSHLAEGGLLAPDSHPRDGVAATTPYDRAAVDTKLLSLVRSARFEGFCAQQPLVAFIDRFLGSVSHLHKRKIMRFTMPHSGVATPAHYDLVYLRGGTTRIVTAWIPIGDITRETGGLVYLRGSHTLGQEFEAEFTRRNAALSPEERISAYNRNMSEGGWISKDLPAMAEQFNAAWMVADYQAGDVMLHSPFMIHGSTDNTCRQNRIRLSTDIRFQSVDAPADARWSKDWSYDDNL